MATIGSEERAAICDGFARLLAERCSEADVRRTMADPSGHDMALWDAIAAMGVSALLVPEAHGGIDGGPVEMELLMERAGAVLLAGPLASSAFVAASLIAGSRDEAAKRRLLPEIAAGRRQATVAFTGDAGSWTPEGIAVRAERAADGWRLAGHASYVLSANIADSLLVFATTEDGIGCFELTSGRDGVRLDPLTAWDPGLRLSRLTFDAAPAVRLDGVGGAGFEAALDIARVALAGEQAGAARRIFEITIDYLKTRVQFGRPIGGFQALKHIAADLLVEVESATSAARAAAAALAAGAPDKDKLVSLAAFSCADAFSEVAAAAIQLHGGIAFTWDHPAHLYLRRARAGAQLFGQSDAYRERFVRALENAA